MLGIVVSITSCATGKHNTTTPEASQNSNTDPLKEARAEAIMEARKEVKKYKKEGFHTFLGDVSIEKQIENARLKTIAMNDLKYPEYIIGYARVTAGNITAAKSQALHIAKVEIASQLSSMIATLIESSVANNEVTEIEAQTLNKYTQASKELIVADLGQIHKDIEIYRELPNKNIQIITRLSYHSSSAMEAARRRIQKEMESETQTLHQKLDKILNLQLPQSESNSNK